MVVSLYFNILLHGSLSYWLNICFVCLFVLCSVYKWIEGRRGGLPTNGFSFRFFLFTFNNRGNIVISLAYLFVCVCGFCIYLGVCENVQMGPAFVFYQEKKKDELDYFLVER